MSGESYRKICMQKVLDNISHLYKGKINEAEIKAKLIKFIKQVNTLAMRKVSNTCIDNHIPINWDSKMVTEMYGACLYTYGITLDPESGIGNDEIFKDVLEDKINVLKDNKPEYFLNSVNNDIISVINLRSEQKINIKTSQLYTCKNCGGNLTRTKERTIRRADEGNSLEIVCQNPKCGHRWLY